VPPSSPATGFRSPRPARLCANLRITVSPRCPLLFSTCQKGRKRPPIFRRCHAKRPLPRPFPFSIAPRSFASGRRTLFPLPSKYLSLLFSTQRTFLCRSLKEAPLLFEDMGFFPLPFSPGLPFSNSWLFFIVLEHELARRCCRPDLSGRSGFHFRA